MDWNKLQHTLFEMDPTDPAEDMRKLAESASALTQKGVATDVNYVQESVEVQEGSLEMDRDYSIADFAALAGVTLNESQKTGSAGQAKGRDSMPKAEPGRTKHPLKDKLVGEDFKKGWDSVTKQNFNTLEPIISNLKNKDKNKDKSKTPVIQKKSNTSSASLSAQLAPYEAQLTKVLKNSKSKAKFEQFLDLWAPKTATTEAQKSKPIKARDPSAQYMNDLRRSGAMGAHADKKRDAKMGKQKHKKDYTNESIKEMLYRKLNNSK